ncbi:MAG: hypothetical protein AMJ53_18225 [Gammaproteobacteria bacterium SG8_11]|nr:MAG: hypothetical protein AMJ53_18225 [Gammaproteobacteria bacterium SG8_11]
MQKLLSPKETYKIGKARDTFIIFKWISISIMILFTGAIILNNYSDTESLIHFNNSRLIMLFIALLFIPSFFSYRKITLTMAGLGIFGVFGSFVYSIFLTGSYKHQEPWLIVIAFFVAIFILLTSFSYFGVVTGLTQRLWALQGFDSDAPKLTGELIKRYKDTINTLKKNATSFRYIAQYQGGHSKGKALIAVIDNYLYILNLYGYPLIISLSDIHEVWCTEITEVIGSFEKIPYFEITLHFEDSIFDTYSFEKTRFSTNKLEDTNVFDALNEKFIRKTQ